MFTIIVSFVWKTQMFKERFFKRKNAVYNQDFFQLQLNFSIFRVTCHLMMVKS